MDSTDDRLSVLRRMRKEGRITHDEFDDLARDLPGVAKAQRTVVDEDDTRRDDPDADSEDQAPGLALTLRKDLSGMYLVGLAIAAVALIVAASIDALPWLVSLSVVLLLATTLFRGLRVLTRVGAVVVAGFVIVGALSSLTGDEPPAVQSVAPGPATEESHPPVPGSLGVYMDQVSELWNSVDGPPRIVRGLTRHNEIGEYDTFLYRFGEWGRVAGAFDPDNEVLYALLAAGQLGGEGTDQLYLHLCFMVAPYSQECIDSYRQNGLGGGTLEDFRDIAHEAEWTLGDHTWRLEIDQNVVTIRIYGEDAI